jgi:hypothetical protein
MNLFAAHLSQKPFGKELPIVPGDADVLARLLESIRDPQSGAYRLVAVSRSEKKTESK